MHISKTMNVMVYEMFEAIQKSLSTGNRQEAIDLLKNSRATPVLLGYLKLNFDPNVTFLLPAGKTPFKRQTDVPDGYSLTDLKQELRRMGIFTGAGDYKNLQRTRREQLWIQMCEGLHWKESELIDAIKDRRLNDIYPCITIDFVRDAFPDQFAGAVAQPLEIPEPFVETPPEEITAEMAIAEYIAKEKELQSVPQKLSFDKWDKEHFVLPEDTDLKKPVEPPKKKRIRRTPAQIEADNKKFAEEKTKKKQTPQIKKKKPVSAQQTP